jgi:DNA-binding PadR family transcriptional regulator
MPVSWRSLSDPWGPLTAFALGSRPRFFRFGEVRLAVLSLLGEGSKHGYQLMKELAGRSGGLCSASAGSVYPTLQQLEAEGLIESEKREGRRIYRLTEAGQRELDRDPAAVRAIWERAENWGAWAQRMGPEALAIAKPAGAVVKAALWAVNRAAGAPAAEDRIRAILRRACRDLDRVAKEQT